MASVCASVTSLYLVFFYSGIYLLPRGELETLMSEGPGFPDLLFRALGLWNRWRISRLSVLLFLSADIRAAEQVLQNLPHSFIFETYGEPYVRFLTAAGDVQHIPAEIRNATPGIHAWTHTHVSRS